MDARMPEAIQDRLQVSAFHKAINVAVEDNLIRKLNSIADITIKCGIYQGKALSLLLFCVALNQLSALLDRSAYGYRFYSSYTINHLLYMNDIKSYAKNEQDID